MLHGNKSVLLLRSRLIVSRCIELGLRGYSRVGGAVGDHDASHPRRMTAFNSSVVVGSGVGLPVESLERVDVIVPIGGVIRDVHITGTPHFDLTDGES